MSTINPFTDAPEVEVLDTTKALLLLALLDPFPTVKSVFEIGVLKRPTTQELTIDELTMFPCPVTNDWLEESMFW